MSAYEAYSNRFPEEDGHPWVMAPELLGRDDFEAILEEAVQRGQPLTQEEVSQRLGQVVDWTEGVEA